jgi:heme-degrading monooxygenase HmoA
VLFLLPSIEFDAIMVFEPHTHGSIHGRQVQQRETLSMITVGMNYHVIAGKEAAFEQKFAAVKTALMAAPGHSTSTLWKDVEDFASYLITSEWSDDKAFQDFIHSDAFREVTNWGKEQILSGRPQHKIYKH